MAADPLLQHSQEFTDVETNTLTLWNQLQDAEQTALALQILRAGLMLEHYTSLLPHVAADRSAEQLAQLAKLRQTFSAVEAQALGVLAEEAGPV